MEHDNKDAGKILELKRQLMELFEPEKRTYNKVTDEELWEQIRALKARAERIQAKKEMLVSKLAKRLLG